MTHINTGVCPKCLTIFETYPNFNEHVKSWFIAFQQKHPEAHISAAGRGKAQQEDDFKRGVSRAHYGQSPHNYNCAVDLFKLTQAQGALFDRGWYQLTMIPDAMAFGGLEAGGNWGAFKDWPHIELAGWNELVKAGTLKLVE